MHWSEQTLAELLIEAGDIALHYFNKAKVSVKPDSSLVTNADVEVEAFFRKHLDKPEKGIYLIGEETVSTHSEEYVEDALNGCTFVVDPIDGTAVYASGLEMWGISLGYMEQGKLKKGAIYLPCFGELWMTHGDNVVRMTIENKEIQGSIIQEHEHGLGPGRGMTAVTQTLVKFGMVDLRGPIQAIGSAVYPLVRLCGGHYFAYLGSLKLWDIAGGFPLVQRLGLDVHLLNGTPWNGQVSKEFFNMAPRHRYRWQLRDILAIVQPGCPNYFNPTTVQKGRFSPDIVKSRF